MEGRWLDTWHCFGPLLMKLHLCVWEKRLYITLITQIRKGLNCPKTFYLLHRCCLWILTWLNKHSNVIFLFWITNVLCGGEGAELLSRPANGHEDWWRLEDPEIHLLSEELLGKWLRKQSQSHGRVWVGRDLKTHPVPIPCHVQGHFSFRLSPNPSNLALEHPTGPPSEIWLKDVPKGVSQVSLFVTDLSRVIYTNRSEDPECAFPGVYRETWEAKFLLSDSCEPSAWHNPPQLNQNEDDGFLVPSGCFYLKLSLPSP